MSNQSNVSDIKDASKKNKGLDIHISMPVSYLYAGGALILGVVVGRKFNIAAAKAAKATEKASQSVSEMVE